jgi:hypothetical protein
MSSPTHTLFRAAILAEQQVVCIYDGRYRGLCPHIQRDKSGAIIPRGVRADHDGNFSSVILCFIPP